MSHTMCLQSLLQYVPNIHNFLTEKFQIHSFVVGYGGGEVGGEGLYTPTPCLLGNTLEEFSGISYFFIFFVFPLRS